MKKYLENLYISAVALNHKNIFSLFEKNPIARFLDLGCDDGLLTQEMANIIETNDINGVEIVEERIKLAEHKGIKIKNFDLNGTFDYENESFDIIHANQVIEHISNLDNFISEIFRILKPQGYVVISTENNSSWHNIIASILGWQTFSSASFSSKQMGIGNPLSIHHNETSKILPWHNSMHKLIFNYRGLKDFFKLYGFINITILGAGYYPLPASIGKIDPRHAHFITLRAFKS